MRPTSPSACRILGVLCTAKYSCPNLGARYTYWNTLELNPFPSINGLAPTVVIRALTLRQYVKKIWRRVKRKIIGLLKI